MKNFIIILYLIFSTFCFKFSKADIIQSVPRREKALLNIEVTKLNTVPLKIRSLNSSKNTILLEDLNLDLTSHSLLLGENSENFSALFSVNGRLPAIKNILKESNLSFTPTEDSQILIHYKNLPTVFYLGVLNKKNKSLEKIYSVDTNSTFSLIKSQGQSSAEVSIQLFYSPGQDIYLPDFKVGADYILPIGKISIRKADTYNWVNLGWASNSNYIHFRTKENNGWINQGVFRFRKNSEIFETLNTGENSEWEIVFTIPWASIEVALNENSPLLFKNNQQTYFEFQTGEFLDAPASFGPFQIFFGEDSSAPPVVSQLIVSGGNLKDGHIFLNFGSIFKGDKKNFSVTSDIFSVERKEGDSIFSNGTGSIDFYFSNGDEVILQNLSSGRKSSNLRAKTSVVLTEESAKNINFKIISTLQAEEIERADPGTYFGASVLNIVVK
jgi:hypothetical protein